MKNKVLKQLKSSDLAPLRKKLHKEQNEVCPILKMKVPLEDTVIDHQHKQKKADEPGVNGAGLVRGCINRYANIIEGKVTNSWKRTQMEAHYPDISLPEFLRNLADYLEQDNLPLIHPSEKIPEKKLMKSSYNKLKKIVEADGKKIPPYPKRKNLTKALEMLYCKYNQEPEYY